MSPKWISLFVVCVVVCGVLEALPIENEPSSAMENLEAQESAFGIQPSSEGGQLVRDKRTIGFLRQAFPTLSQIIDRKIQAITRLLFRLIGRLVLRGAAGGGGGGGGGTDADSSGGDNGRRISITLPTFAPSADDSDEDEDSTDSDSTPGSEDSSTTTTEASDTENTVSESKLAPVVVRKTRQVNSGEEEEEDDQAAEATGDNELSSSVEETDDNDASESGESEDPRDKRLVNFNLGGGGSGGSGGGSGNFLFDIIRLVAGSGTTQSEDEANNAPLEGNVTAKGDDGYSAGVPGPLTRLFVIANRGIANLIQDLILRLAQTSERIVNFKARLITSII